MQHADTAPPPTAAARDCVDWGGREEAGAVGSGLECEGLYRRVVRQLLRCGGRAEEHAEGVDDVVLGGSAEGGGGELECGDSLLFRGHVDWVC